MKSLKTKITSLADQRREIELESYQVDIENGHDIKMLLRKKTKFFIEISAISQNAYRLLEMNL
jgi:hypothetical protein